MQWPYVGIELTVNTVVELLLLVGCLTPQQHASVSQGRICSDKFTCCHTDIEVADPTFHLTQSQCTDPGPTSPSTDPITPGAWQGSHWSANFEVTGMTRPRKNPGASGIRTRDLPLSRRTVVETKLAFKLVETSGHCSTFAREVSHCVRFSSHHNSLPTHWRPREH